MARSASLSVQHRRYWLLLTYVLLVLPAVGYGAWRAIKSNANSPIDWVPACFPARRDYDQFREAFVGGDVVVISWPGCTVDEPKLDVLAHVLRKAKAFYDDDGHWYFEQVVTGREMFQRLVNRPINLSREEALRRLRGTLVGPDGRTTCALVTFTAAGLERRKKLVSLIRGALKGYCAVGADGRHLAGPVIDGLSVDIASKRALSQFTIPSAAIVLCVCWCCLGSWRASLLVFGLSVLAQAVTLALVHYSGQTMSALLIVMPPLIQVLAVAGGIHLVNYYFDATRDPRETNPASRAFQLGWLPCVLSAGTTAIGLASLMVSELTPIRLFGMYASAGVLITTGLLLTIIPGTFLIWPLKIASTAADRTNLRSPRATHGIWSSLTSGLAKVHWLVVAASLAVMIGAGYGIPRINTSVRIETLFSTDSRILRDYRWLEEHVGPLVPIEIVLECAKGCRLSFSERFALAARIERALKQLDEVGGTMSAATFAPRFASRPNLPPNIHRQYIDKILERNRPWFVAVRYLEDTRNGDRLRITASISALADMDYGKFLSVIRDKVSPLIQDKHGNRLSGLSVRYTGIMPLVHEIQRQLMSDLFKSLLLALATITVVMTMVEGGVLTGLVSMVPNVFPILLMFGTLGWLDVALDIGSVMTASVALGIAVDDTLHFLTFFRRGLDSGLTRQNAVLEAYRHCGAAMLQTTIACGLGLLIFVFSDFVPTSRFAWMMPALLSAALFGDFIVLPSLLLGPLGTLFGDRTNESAPPQPSDRDRSRATHTAAPRHAVAVVGE